MPITTTVKNKVLNMLVGKDSDYPNVFVGLSSTKPDSAGGNISEPPAGTGYGRVLIGSNNASASQKFSSPSGGRVANDEYIYFPESSDAWGDPLTHFFLTTSEMGSGTIIGYGELTADGVSSPVLVNAPKTVVMFRPGTLVITIQDD